MSALAAIAVFPVLTLLLIGLSRVEGLLSTPGPKNARTEPVYEPATPSPVEPAAAAVPAVTETVAPASATAGPEPAVPVASPAPETRPRPLPRLRSVQSSSLRKISLSSLNRAQVGVEALPR